MSPTRREILSTSPAETAALALRLAPLLQAGDFIALQGDLGAGKTFLVQSLCAALGYAEGVRSPTFVLLHHYPVGGRVGTVFHFDLYRLQTPDQLDDLGYEEYFYEPPGVCLVEWAERAGRLLPEARLELLMTHGEGMDERRITVQAHGRRAHELLQAL